MGLNRERVKFARTKAVENVNADAFRGLMPRKFSQFLLAHCRIIELCLIWPHIPLNFRHRPRRVDYDGFIGWRGWLIRLAPWTGGPFWPTFRAFLAHVPCDLRLTCSPSPQRCQAGRPRGEAAGRAAQEAERRTIAPSRGDVNEQRATLAPLSSGSGFVMQPDLGIAKKLANDFPLSVN